MIHKYKYWIFEKALDPNLCDAIVKIGLSKQKKKALVLGFEEKEKEGKLTEKDLKEINEIRQSNVAWLNEPWLYKILQNYLEMANVRSGWEYQWSHSEEIQFTEYKDGCFYDWHADSDDNSTREKVCRKLSMSVSLTDPKEYEGGEFEFDYRNKTKTSAIEEVTRLKPKGSILVFPSYIFHRVKPVTKGTRHSLVMWTLGNLWR